MTNHTNNNIFSTNNNNNCNNSSTRQHVIWRLPKSQQHRLHALHKSNNNSSSRNSNIALNNNINNNNNKTYSNVENWHSRKRDRNWCRRRGGNRLQTLEFLYLCLVLSSLHAAQAFCPSKCQCLGGDANSRAYCIDAALEDVPIQLNPESKYINLTLNKIRHLEFTLPFYMKLEVLDLSQNIIETLGSKNFEYQTELRTLNLSRNSVSSLQKDAFKGLSNLLLLDLSNNRIETVHPTAMADLTSLIELDLTNNNIVSLEDNCFRNMISLEILIMRNNQLLDVPAGNLFHLHSLKSLDLSVNLIEYVRNDSFEGLRELMLLTMRGNVISELDFSAFEGLIALKHMDLADNNLTMVPTQQLSKLSNLTYLSLSGNRFTHLPAVAFLNLFHLRELHLSRLDHLIRIDSRAFVDNTHLLALHLSNNPQLIDIPMRLFQGNPNILDVFMQGNSLQTLYAAQFPVDQLRRLYLGDNPLQCNCSLLWLWRLVTGNFDEAHSSDGVNGGAEPNSNPILHAKGAEASVAALGVSSETREGAAAAYVAAAESGSNRLTQTTHAAANDVASPAIDDSVSSVALRLDTERIGCEVWRDSVRKRRLLAAMVESDITCPAHIVTIVCAVLTGLLVLMTGASIVFYLRFVKRRRKLLHDRSTLRGGKSIVNVHDRILQHQPLSGGGGNGGNGGTMNGSSAGTMAGMLGGGGGNAYHHHPHYHHHGGMGGGGGVGGGVPPSSTHHMLQPLHSTHDYQQTLVPQQVDKLELERYLAAQAIANEYRALKPWELPPPVPPTAIKDGVSMVVYGDEPEHLYEKFDHYEYPDTHTMTKSKQNTLASMVSAGGNNAGNNGGKANGTLSKPHVVYV